ncbi:hypothetical protein [Salinarchaeum sp. Harcht-Bsk1]|uniref:hypothetical protein n=1 Tax=Salinarchaeum sp. Harcht-Bsk1 TaxID=1333523 RepID=UPI001F1A4718|nr:hypothetical protein [Salinarchaeum sp. Harcht-Bsk1]
MTDENTCGRSKRGGSGESCGLPAGWGTDHPGEGACKLHGGNAGAPEGNNNAETHALNADPYNYYSSLDREQKEFIHRVSSSIEDRIREDTGGIDSLDEKLAMRIAIELHIVSKASDYVMNVSGLTQVTSGEEGSREYQAALLGEIRKRDRAIVQMLRDLGVLNDSESKKAEFLDEWRSWVEDGDRGIPQGY